MPIHDWTRVTAGTFHDFHSAWITHIKERLNTDRLPPGYFAMSEQFAGGVVPDVLTLTSAEWTPEEDSSLGSSATERTPGDSPQGAVALAEAPPKVSLRVGRTEEEIYRQKRRTISIRQEPNNRVVAMIEILSPGNKDIRRTLNEFVENSTDAMHREIHLLVVDLFPPGPADPHGIHRAIWGGRDELPPDRPLTLVSYRVDGEWEAFIEPVRVGQELPDMPVFLDPEWYVNVPLESTYQSAWRGVPAPYRRILEGDSATTTARGRERES